jgi:hypothetical protein
LPEKAVTPSVMSARTPTTKPNASHRARACALRR